MTTYIMNKEIDVSAPEQLCAMCEEGLARRVYRVQELQHGSGRQATTLRAKVPVWECATCGEAYVDDEGEAAQHAAICRHLGRLAPAEIRGLRKSLDLKQAQFAEALGVGSASVKRWELGKAIPNYLADVAMRRLADTVRRAREPVYQTQISREIKEAAARFKLRQSEQENGLVEA